ncbi:hypothetical protein ABZ070_10225 [Streptomyces sp. NPDC006283]|uniref:hypothetical protein n=1 Tax=Streptomyces sp. NPDC006283 TaxID=3156741 RepID=UPI00339E71FF
MNITNNLVTLGGVVVGLAILTTTLIRWVFQEKKRPAALAPFLLALAYGMLLILSAGGILGAAADIALWGANGLGDLTLVWGVGGGTQNVTRAAQMALTNGGHAVVILLTVALLALWKFAGKVPNGKLAAGILCGICLGLSGAVAGAAAVPLASGANLLGLGLTAVL